jgi:FKBP-type peptidyl-prolyl cis-trans isomerase SlyD
MKVSPGMKVSIEYILKLEDNAVIDSNVGASPLIYFHGFQQIIPGLEKALEGMTIGESKQVTVSPEEGYGIISQQAFTEVKKEQVSQDAQTALRVDAHVRGRDASGSVFHARVAEIKDQTVVLDFNHPLAGRTLYYEVKVLDIQQAPIG